MSVIKIKGENNKNNQNEKKFTVLLNGEKDLEDQLEQFKQACNVYNEEQCKRSKTRYYNLSLMAEVEKSTTHEEVKLLLKNNIRTFLVDIVTHKLDEVESLTELIRHAVKEQQFVEPNNKLAIGMTLQITGDACRIGRFRNNCSIFLAQGDTMTLTTNTAYRYCCFKEIAYVINLQHYLSSIKLNDEISIDHTVRGCVIKKLASAVAIRIEESGIISSYDLVELPSKCYSLELPALVDIFKTELELAAKLQVDFIALPYIRFLPFLKLLERFIKCNCRFKIIGSIDLEYISHKMLDLIGIIKYLDCLWLTDLFNSDQALNTIVMQDVIPIAKRFKKPVIGSVPLERSSDFKMFENHEFLWIIDCIFIKKSQCCSKYPLIVKKLLPIKDYRLAVVDNNDMLSNCQSIVHFIIRTIRSIECQAIFLHTKCEIAAKALSRVEIYCPVYVIFSLDELSNNTQEFNYYIELAKNLNLRRNLRPLLYTSDMNECKHKPIDYGIEYARKSGILETGDFIITLEVIKDNGDEHFKLGMNEDVALMRTIYVPPVIIGENFECT